MKNTIPTNDQISSFLYPLANFRGIDTSDSELRDEHIYHPTTVKGNTALFGYLSGQIMGPLEDSEGAIIKRWEEDFDINKDGIPLYNETSITKNVVNITRYLLSNIK